MGSTADNRLTMLIARTKRRLTHAFIDRGIFRHALEERLKRNMLTSPPTATVPVHASNGDESRAAR